MQSQMPAAPRRQPINLFPQWRFPTLGQALALVDRARDQEAAVNSQKIHFTTEDSEPRVVTSWLESQQKPLVDQAQSRNEELAVSVQKFARLSSNVAAVRRYTEIVSPRPRKYFPGGNMGEKHWLDIKEPHPEPSQQMEPVRGLSTIDEDQHRSLEEAFNSKPNELTHNQHYKGFSDNAMSVLSSEGGEHYGGVRLPQVNAPTFSIRGQQSNTPFRERAANLRVNTSYGSDPMMELPVSMNNLKDVNNAASRQLSAPAIIGHSQNTIQTAPPQSSFKVGPATSGWNVRTTQPQGQQAPASAHVMSSQYPLLSSNEDSQSGTLTQTTQSADFRSTAKALAAFICSGGLENEIIGSSANSLVSPDGKNQSSGYATATQTSPVGLFLPAITPAEQRDPITPLLKGPEGASYRMLLEHVPFCSLNDQARAAPWGVVKVSDIPYNTKRQEIVALFGRNARLVSQPSSSPHYAIHILIDRNTAKSMDCYVELQTVDEAAMTVARLNNTAKYGKKPRVQDRQVQIELSNMETLMEALFPRAKRAVYWQGQVPRIVSPNTKDAKSFTGFIHAEEMFLTKQWVEKPGRSRFARNHLQRPFESMITLLYKYPWFASHLYTIGERDVIFKTTLEMAAILAEHLIRHPELAPRQEEYHVLTRQLLEELLLAGFAVPAFSERQRSSLAQVAFRMQIALPAYVTGFSQYWPFEVLRMKLTVGEDLVAHYAYLLNMATFYNKSLPAAFPTNNPFGKFRVSYPVPSVLAHQTLAEVAEYEMSAVATMLTHCAPRGTA